MTRALRWCVWVLAWLHPRVAFAAPPTTRSPDAETPSQTEPERAATATLSGRVRERGSSRAPVSGAVVIVVDAPDDVRPRRRDEVRFDPERVTWMFRVETDADGKFEIASVPVGRLVVVVVAGGYARLEHPAKLEPDGSEIELFVEPEHDSRYRTVVETERRESWTEIPAHATLDAQRARHYPGSGDDPLLAALNLPGIARSPGGLGLISFRGGDPTEVGVYVDGHPVPRGFHVIPIASVVSPPMVDGIELSPGTYSARYGGYGGGLVQISSRPGRRDGIHGEAHLDLFDVGATTQGAVGKGSVHVGVRRSHLGEVLDAVLPLLDLQAAAPNFWDYLARFDHPAGHGHSIGLRAFGAGDRLSLSEYFDFRSNFHRFDFDYRYKRGAWQVLLSPSLRLDRTTLEQQGESAFARRHAKVYSARAAFVCQAHDHLALDFGADAIVERWQRSQTGQLLYNEAHDEFEVTPRESSQGAQLRAGAWLATPVRIGDWSVIPSLRLNVFMYGPKPSVRPDPRLHVRGPLSKSVQLVAAAGLYAIPLVGARKNPSQGAITDFTSYSDTAVDIPQYLITYFDPNIGGEVNGRYTSATHVFHASIGFEAKLPRDLELRALGFWRSAFAHSFDNLPWQSFNEFFPGFMGVGGRRASSCSCAARWLAACSMDGSATRCSGRGSRRTPMSGYLRSSISATTSSRC